MSKWVRARVSGWECEQVSESVSTVSEWERELVGKSESKWVRAWVTDSVNKWLRALVQENVNEWGGEWVSEGVRDEWVWCKWGGE